MDLAWMGVIAIVVMGSFVVAYGWLSDQTSAKIHEEELYSPPERYIPGLPDETPSPKYLTALEIAITDPISLDLTDGQRAQILTEIEDTKSLPLGYDSIEYLTDLASRWAVHFHPIVLVTDAELTHLRELLPAIRMAKTMGSPLVTVAAGCASDLKITLAANMRNRSFVHLLLTTTDETLVAELSQLTNAQLIPLEQLRSGYLPANSLGRCNIWVSDANNTWVL